jgi:non-ribosomal peptide synthetase component E (peptide arylation enzyme)
MKNPSQASMFTGLQVDPQRAAQYESEGLWRNTTIVDSFDAALRRAPEKMLVVSGRCRWTYREVADRVGRLAQSLSMLGVGPGDVVSIQLPNWPEFVLVYLAATQLGAITNPLLPLYREKELSHILRFAASKVAFIADNFRRFSYPDLYRELAGTLSTLEHVVVVGPRCPPDMQSFDQLLSDAPRLRKPHSDARQSGNNINVLIFTSGTESTPKGVVHTHNTLMYGNVIAARELELTSDEIIWAVSPISHATGLEWCLRQAIVLGATLVLQEIWEVEAALDLIERERCTFTTAATPFAAMLLESPSLQQRDLSSFRTFLCGGAAIPAALGAAMRQHIGCRLIPCWGMSECFAATICNIHDPQEKQWGTDGRAMPGSEMQIFDETRTSILPPGEIGEIATRGPHVCLGYLYDEARTAASFSAEGWLFSNDLGFKDADGFLRVVGRKKDIINRAGLKISAAEIEGLLLQDPDVRAVAVIGVPDRITGEKSCAVVVPAPGSIVTLEQLVDGLNRRGVAPYKLPEFLVLQTELPMTATGKVQKFRLRADWEAGRFRHLAVARAPEAPGSNRLAKS